MNRNTIYAEIFVDELARSGLKAVCAAPGSRHTPLMLAFAKHPDIKVYSHLDERSASFFALGLALANDAPVALICTSGTAGANMYPAIIEAHQSRVPLIVITADRPPELRHSGANQTIDQIKMFGDFVLWFVDAALPEANPPAVAIRNLRTTANRAYAKANGLRKGVVHINMPFRKPLEPTPVEGDVVEIPQEAQAREKNQPQTVHWRGLLRNVAWREKHLLELVNIIENHSKGIILLGHDLPRSMRTRQDDFSLRRHTADEDGTWRFTNVLKSFARACGYPIIAGSTSRFRFDTVKPMLSLAPEIATIDSLPPQIWNNLQPDVIIRFGSASISKSTNFFLQSTSAKYHILIKSDGDWSDDNHNITHFIQADEFDINQLEFEVSKIWRDYDVDWKNTFIELETTTWRIIDQEMKNGAYFDGGVVYDIVDLIPAESTLFSGNSLPVRLLDQFGKPQDKRIHVYANRGASGIDGNISTALGTGAARPDQPLVAILGDITFYHDMNGLLAVHRCGVPITIVLLNNDGGGIFHRLPIKDYDPEFTDYFLTPHGLDFSHAAKMYGLEHVAIDIFASNAREQFREVFSTSVGSETSTIIEVKTDARADLRRRDEIVAAVHEAIKALGDQ